LPDVPTSAGVVAGILLEDETQCALLYVELSPPKKTDRRSQRYPKIDGQKATVKTNRALRRRRIWREIADETPVHKGIHMKTSGWIKRMFVCEWRPNPHSPACPFLLKDLVELEAHRGHDESLKKSQPVAKTAD